MEYNTFSRRRYVSMRCNAFQSNAAIYCVVPFGSAVYTDECFEKRLFLFHLVVNFFLFIIEKLFAIWNYEYMKYYPIANLPFIK